MLTELQIEGANCSLCLNDIVDRLRGVEGITSVDSSIAEGCIAIDHDELTGSDLVAWIGGSLHGVAMASNEIVMGSVVPSISVLRCPHRDARSHVPTSDHPRRRTDTVTDALEQLRSTGYTTDFYATDEGELACSSCERVMKPIEAKVDDTIRFEGDSNPDDEDIVFALQCVGGCTGTYTAAYGPSAPPNDTKVLRQLARYT